MALLLALEGKLRKADDREKAYEILMKWQVIDWMVKLPDIILAKAKAAKERRDGTRGHAGSGGA